MLAQLLEETAALVTQAGDRQGGIDLATAAATVRRETGSAPHDPGESARLLQAIGSVGAADVPSGLPPVSLDDTLAVVRATLGQFALEAQPVARWQRGFGAEGPTLEA